MRTQARETVFKLIFAQQFQNECPQAFRNALYRTDKLNEEDRAFAERLFAAVSEHSAELSAVLAEKVQRFSEARIYPADKAALLIALAEIKYFDDIPPVVSVSEAVALASKYSTERSADFVNGVLGGVINQ